MIDLEGKWVLFQSDWVGGVCDVKPHRVTRHSKNRIYVSELRTEWDEETSSYLFVEETDPVGFKSVNTVRLVFEDRNSAVEAAYFARAEYDKWFRDQKLEMGRKVLEEAKRVGAKTLKEL